MDFWLTKNVSGRLLCGLRWWSATDPDTGLLKWQFEAWTSHERQLAQQTQVRST
jgi:hypothetical protein